MLRACLYAKQIPSFILNYGKCSESLRSGHRVTLFHLSICRRSEKSSRPLLPNPAFGWSFRCKLGPPPPPALGGAGGNPPVTSDGQGRQGVAGARRTVPCSSFPAARSRTPSLLTGSRPSPALRASRITRRTEPRHPFTYYEVCGAKQLAPTSHNERFSPHHSWAKALSARSRLYIKDVEILVDITYNTTTKMIRLYYSLSIRTEFVEGFL